MFEVMLFFVSVLILGTYAMLFWLVKKECIGFRGAVVMMVVSTASYLVFPALLARVEVQSAILLLLLFILAGLVFMAAADRKVAEKCGLHVNINSRYLTQLYKKLLSSFKPSFALTKSGMKVLFSVIMRTGSEISRKLGELNNRVLGGLGRKESDNKINQTRGRFSCLANSTDKRTVPLSVEEEIEPAGLDTKIIDLSESDQALSYVDFESKERNYEDIFEKYIRGEIILSDVSTKIKERMEACKVQPGDSGQEPEMGKEVHAETASIMEKDFSFGPGEQGEDLNVEAYIEKAFDFKAKGQLLEAVECYIKALDKGPEDDLILWIVVDICSLYRQLGQDHMAREMMMSYIETFGDNLSPQVREEMMGSL